MANAIYAKALNSFINGEINWTSDSILTILINTELYTVDIGNHQWLSDIPAGARVAIAELTNETDVIFPAVSGAICSAIAFVKITGNEKTSNLLLYFDTAIGLPVIPNGGNVIFVKGKKVAEMSVKDLISKFKGN